MTQTPAPKPSFSITLRWVTAGSDHRLAHYQAGSREEALLTATYFVGWYQGNEVEVLDVTITDNTSGEVIPLPPFLFGCLD